MASKSSALPMLKLSSSFLVMARRREGSCTTRSYFYAHRQRLDLGEGSSQCLLTVFSALSVSPPFPTRLFHRAWVGLWNGSFARDLPLSFRSGVLSGAPRPREYIGTSLLSVHTSASQKPVSLDRKFRGDSQLAVAPQPVYLRCRKEELNLGRCHEEACLPPGRNEQRGGTRSKGT